MSKKIIISGGGTGGHIYPAIAIANALKELEPDINFLFVGAEGKMEMEKVPKAGYVIEGLPIAGINRSSFIKNIGLPFKLFKSLRKAFSIIDEFKPDIAIGVGGYASGPMLIAAWIKGIPFVIQEQNSYAGITNKLLSSKAKKIFVAYPKMERFFPKEKIVLLGNPVRKDLMDTKSKKDQAAKFFGLNPEIPTILIIGGSQGARSINKAILAGLDQFFSNPCQIIWQTGISFEKEAKEAIQKNALMSAYVSAFIYEMDFAYSMADLVVSRAGALSVSEICLAGKASILVPLPNAAEDHQTENALSLVRHQAAILVKDYEAKNQLVNTAISTLNNNFLLHQLSESSKKFAKPEAANEIALQILSSLTTK
jgi:UDP-N-acetylglucosamine--N-acetylmuramyl-(pentapeptide) pyrophosphoryl-undecaprenol N-acetylglucosamine transferase